MTPRTVVAAVATSRRIVACVLAVLVVLAAATPALASWRCGSRLVDPGQSLEDVYDLCGEPTSRATSTELITVHPRCGLAVTYPVAVETWTYNRGPRQFVSYLTFRDARLVDTYPHPGWAEA